MAMKVDQLPARPEYYIMHDGRERHDSQSSKRTGRVSFCSVSAKQLMVYLYEVTINSERQKVTGYYSTKVLWY
jgi:hypothetical protein